MYLYSNSKGLSGLGEEQFLKQGEAYIFKFARGTFQFKSQAMLESDIRTILADKKYVNITDVTGGLFSGSGDYVTVRLIPLIGTVTPSWVFNAIEKQMNLTKVDYEVSTPLAEVSTVIAKYKMPLGIALAAIIVLKVLR